MSNHEQNHLAPGISNQKSQTSILEPVLMSHEHEKINLLDLLLVLAVNWKVIVSVPLIVAVITAIITLFMPNIYKAKSMIIPSDDDKGGIGAALMAQVGGLASLAGGAIGAKTTRDLYVTMLESETVKDPIIDRFKLIELYDEKYRTDVYKKLKKIAKIDIGKIDGVITVEVDDKDPKRAADMANAYVEELGKLAAGLNMTGAGKNSAFLEKRIAEAHADLSHAEDALKEFQLKNKAISITDQAQATILGVAQLRAQLAVKEIELATLQRQFTDTTQEVKTVKSTVASLKAQIASLEGKGSISSIPNVGNMPQLGQEYLRLMRDFKIQEAVLEMLTKQYEVSKMGEVKDVAPFQILQKAKVPEKKSKPKRLIIVLLATMITGLTVALWAVIKEFGHHITEKDRQILNTIKEQFHWRKRTE